MEDLLDRQAGYFKALSDPTRLRILECLRSSQTSDGLTVGELCGQVTGEAQAHPRISFHLKELRTAGLISMERRGRHLVCKIQEHALREAGDFLNRTETAAVPGATPQEKDPAQRFAFSSFGSRRRE